MEMSNPDKLGSSTNSEVPSHSYFFHLEPQGVGTPYVSSFSGYLLRLAKLHNVTVRDLVYEEILSRIYLHSEVRQKLRRWSDWSSVVDGATNTSRAWTQLLETLTLVPDLEPLTTIRWPDIIGQARLIRKRHAYCPICLDSWLSHEKEPYVPLIWRIAVVTCCPLHEAPLIAACPHPDCGLESLALDANAEVGYCTRCKRSLRVKTPAGTGYTVSEYVLWCANQVANLIAASQQPTEWLSREALYATLETMAYSITGHGLGVLSNRFLHISHTTLLRARLANDRLSIETLLRTCSGLKIDLVDLLTGRTEHCPLLDGVTLDSIRRSKETKDQEQIHTELQWILQAETVLTRDEVALRTRCSTYYLRRHFPELWTQIVNRSRRHHNGRRHAPPSQNERFRVAAIVGLALTLNPPPSPSQVICQCGYTISRFLKHFPTQYRQLSDHYQAERRMRKKEDMTTSRRKPPDIVSIGVQLGQLLSGDYPPISVAKAVEVLGCPKRFLMRHFRDECKKLSERYSASRSMNARERRNRAITKLRQYVAQLHSQGVFPGRSRIDKEFGARAREPWFRAAYKQILRELGYRTDG